MPYLAPGGVAAEFCRLGRDESHMKSRLPSFIFINTHTIHFILAPPIPVALLPKLQPAFWHPLYLPIIHTVEYHVTVNMHMQIGGQAHGPTNDAR
jgi:hypothetical protein